MASDRIRDFLRRAQVRMVLQALARGATRAVPLVCLYVLVMNGLDRWLDLPLRAREIGWFLCLAAAAAALASGFVPLRLFSLRNRSMTLYDRASRYSRARRLRPDDLRLAVEFLDGRDGGGTSAQLREEFISEVARRLESLPPRWCFPAWHARRWLALAAGMLLLTGTVWAVLPVSLKPGARTLLPWIGGSVEQFVRISPGDAFVRWGSDAEIRLELMTRSIDKPLLHVKTETGWAAPEPEVDAAGEQVYRLKSVVAPVTYRVRWKNDWSRRFTLTPTAPARVEKVSVTVTPPAYVRKAPVVQESPEVSGLVGSAVEIRAEAGVPLSSAKIVFSDGREVAAAGIDDRSFTVRFTIDREDDYRFAIEGTGGESSVADEKHPVRILQDQPPVITLLSPDQDIIVGEREKVPLTFDAKDDYGVQDVELVWERRDRKLQRRRVRHFDPAAESGIWTYTWNLADERFQAGEVVRYQLEALDGNAVSGPGRAATLWQIIEIASFEREHDLVEKGLEQWREKAVDLLAEVNTTKARAEKEGADLNAMAADFNKTAQKAAALDELLRQILKRMENDPLADYGLWLEHKAMSESLTAMNQTTVRNTQAAMLTGNKKAAVQNLDETANELERMAALSEQLSKTQNARDVTNAGEKLSEAGEDLINQLESAADGGKLDSETLSRINDIMSQAMEAMKDMVRSLQKNPEELPEDFVNQKALKDLDIGKSQDLMAQLNDAIKKGDAKRALELAKQFLAAARQMSRQLNEANESYLQENSAGEIAKQISEQQKKLDEITDEQRRILSETQKLESKRLEAVMKAQEALLDQLAKRQRAVIDAAGNVIRDPKLAPTPRAYLQMQLRPMEEIAQEFAQRRVDKAPERLPQIIDQLRTVQTELLKSTPTASLADRIGGLIQEETDILAQLKKPSEAKPGYSSAENESFASLQQRQAELSKRTQGLRRSLQALSRKTASLGVPLTQALGDAGDDMRDAADQLGARSSQSAQRLEESALSRLQQGQDALQQAQNAMQEMAGEQGGEGGGGGGPSMKVLRRGGGGQSGMQINKVRLPTAEDYRPPREFREELLESLREKYPKTYEEIIHKYYKRLSE